MRIAFDLDGTLIDSLDHIHVAVSRGLSEMDLPIPDRATFQGFVGRGLPFAMARVLDHLERSQNLHPELCERVLAHYTAMPSDPDSVYPGVHEALTALRDKGHALAICTNKPFQAALAALRDTRLQPYFDLVLGGDSLPVRKPDPAALLPCAPDLYMGDSEVDAETAERAKIPFLLFTEGYRKTPTDQIPHDHAFNDWTQAPTLVSKYPKQ